MADKRADTVKEMVEQAGQALKAIPYPLLVVGTEDAATAGKAHFMVANWGTQASFEPRRFAIAVKKEANTLENLRTYQAFTVNLLDESQKEMPREVLGTGGENLPTTQGPVRAPRLKDAYAGFDCRVVDVVDIGGDHHIVVGEVEGGWKEGFGPTLTVEDVAMKYAG